MSCEVPDRLNLGCGLDYRAGYLNLDRSPAAVADAIVSAHTLELPAAHFREILLNDVIEHLGYCGTYRLLIALFPTLRDDGELRISTPDLDRSIAQYVQATSAAERESVLCQIYGSEEPGMSHQFCFPRDCLIELLARCGYLVVSSEERTPAPLRPQLQLVARRDNAPLAIARNALTAQILAAPNLHIGYADFPYFEGLCDLAWQATSGADFEEFFRLGRTTSPRLTLLLLRGLRDRLSAAIGEIGWREAEHGVAELARRDLFAPLGPLVADGTLASFDAARRWIELTPSAPAAADGNDGFASDFFTAERFAEFVQRRRALALRAEAAQEHTVPAAVEP